MTRNLKALGLALVAVFAMSAIAASGASAAVFTSGGDNVELAAEATSEQLFFVPETSLKVECENIEVDETFVGTEATAITAAPTYPNTIEASNECVALGFDATIDMNGCHYLFTAAGSVHIQCPVGKQIEVTAYILGATRKCLDVPAQTPTEPSVSYENKGSGAEADIELTSNVEGIEYEKTGLCGSGGGNNAVYEGSATVTGWEGAKQVAVEWDE